MTADPIRTVLVGCGGITTAWLRAPSREAHFDIVGVVDLDRAAAAGLRERWGLERAVVGTDLAAVISETGAEAVFDCTVPKAHPQVTATALAAGCHVLGEKPMAEDLETARASVAAAATHERIYAVIQNRRYLRSIRRLRDFLAAGAIGAVRELHADFFIPAHFGGFRQHMPHVLLWDMAIHSFDQGRFLAGSAPRRAWCHEWNPPGSWYERDANALAIFEMAEDRVFTYRGSWCATGAQTSWECSWRILGTHGAVRWDGAEEIVAEALVDPEQPSAEAGGGLMRERQPLDVPPLDDPGFREGHDGLLAEFARALRGGPEPETVAHDNIQSVAMVAAAVESARSGRWVDIAS